MLNLAAAYEYMASRVLSINAVVDAMVEKPYDITHTIQWLEKTF